MLFVFFASDKWMTAMKLGTYGLQRVTKSAQREFNFKQNQSRANETKNGLL